MSSSVTRGSKSPIPRGYSPALGPGKEGLTDSGPRVTASSGGGMAAGGRLHPTLSAPVRVEGSRGSETPVTGLSSGALKFPSPCDETNTVTSCTRKHSSSFSLECTRFTEERKLRPRGKECAQAHRGTQGWIRRPPSPGGGRSPGDAAQDVGRLSPLSTPASQCPLPHPACAHVVAPPAGPVLHTHGSMGPHPHQETQHKPAPEKRLWPTMYNFILSFVYKGNIDLPPLRSLF